MAMLSDYADRSALSHLAVPMYAQLQQCCCVRALHQLMDSVVPPEPARATLDRVLWLLCNLTADERTATKFTKAGGAELLVALLKSVNSSRTVSSSRLSEDPTLHICMAIAAIALSFEAASALLDAGIVTELVRSLSLQSEGHTVPGCLDSIADAEAECRALSTVLKSCAAASSQELVCRELAVSGAIDCCTALLKYAITSESMDDPVKFDGM